MTSWINLENIADEDKIYPGAVIKIMPTARGLEEGNFIPRSGLIYLVADSALDKSYFNCVCLSSGEEGNVICALARKGRNFASGAELKRMFKSPLQDAFLSRRADIAVS